MRGKDLRIFRRGDDAAWPSACGLQRIALFPHHPQMGSQAVAGKLKLQHRRGVWGIYGRKGALMLGFGAFEGLAVAELAPIRCVGFAFVGRRA